MPWSLLVCMILALSATGYASDNVSVRVLAEETDTPLNGLPVKITVLHTNQVLEQTSNERGLASFTVVPPAMFKLEVYGIRISGPTTDVFTISPDTVLPTIQVSLSKKQLAQAEDFQRRKQDDRTALALLRARVDKADIYRAARAFLDTLLEDQILPGDTLIFTSNKTGKVVELVSDDQGFVFFKGYEAGLQQGETYSVTCASSSSIRGGMANSCPSREFTFKGDTIPADWDGGFPYMTVPVGNNRLTGAQFGAQSSTFTTNPTLERELTVLAKLIQSRGYAAEIQGHTDNASKGKDSVQSVQANLALSQRRAEAIRKHLIEKYKVAPESVTAVGYGQEFPVADNATEAGRALNRRVMIKVRPKRN